MKPYNFFLCSFIIVSSACVSVSNHTNAQPPVLSIQDKTLIPEGITVQPGTGKIFISSIVKHKIVSIDENGKTSDIISPRDGVFMQGLGMKFSADGKLLWVCSSADEGKTALFCIDVLAKTILGQYTHDSARFFNDLVIGDDDNIFITDTYRGEVFLFNASNKKIKEWLRHPNLTYANGIALSNDKKVLFVASGRYGVQRVELTDKKIESVSGDKHVDYGVDGMVCSGKQLFCVIGWPQDKPETHRVVRYQLSERNFFIKSDTLMIGGRLKAPTTAALANNHLLVLNNTGLDIYNAHQQRLAEIKDSLTAPNIITLKIK